MNDQELKKILADHALWLKDNKVGERANLVGANLVGANLYGAKLVGASLKGADLEGANLQGVIVNRYTVLSNNFLQTNRDVWACLMFDTATKV